MESAELICFLSFDGGFDDAFRGFLFKSELAAGGVDVVAFFEAEVCGDSGVLKDLLERAEGTALDGGFKIAKYAESIALRAMRRTRFPN